MIVISRSNDPEIAEIARNPADSDTRSGPARILIDGRRLNASRTGVGRYLECLLNAWSISGLPCRETRVILSSSSGRELVPQLSGLHADVVAPRLPGLLWERWALGRALRSNDLLFAPTNLVPANWSGPTVVVMFDALQEVRPQDFAPLLRLRFGSRYRSAVTMADRVIVPSEATARDVSRIYGVSSARMTVIHPAPDPQFRPLPPDATEVIDARQRLGLGRDPFFLFVGKQSRRRNVPAILRAFRQHRASYPAHRLVFVGDHSPTRQTAAPSIGDGILDAGHVPDSILRGLMASALGVLYPSEHEGFGLPVIEAMASGCPVITLRRDALREAGGEAAIYLDEATPERLTEAMSALAGDPAWRESRILAGLAQAARFSMNGFADGVRRELRRAWDERRCEGRDTPR